LSSSVIYLPRSKDLYHFRNFQPPLLSLVPLHTLCRTTRRESRLTLPQAASAAYAHCTLAPLRMLYLELLLGLALRGHQVSTYPGQQKSARLRDGRAPTEKLMRGQSGAFSVERLMDFVTSLGKTWRSVCGPSARNTAKCPWFCKPTPRFIPSHTPRRFRSIGARGAIGRTG
jgi:hypothetical protein